MTSQDDNKENPQLTKSAEVHALVYDEKQIIRFVELINAKECIHVLTMRGYGKDSEEVLSIYPFYDSNVDNFMNLIKHYERPVGCYDNKEQIPYLNTGIFCTITPRNGKLAAANFVEFCLRSLLNNSDNFNKLPDVLNGFILSNNRSNNLIESWEVEKRNFSTVRETLSEDVKPIAVIETIDRYVLIMEKDSRLDRAKGRVESLLLTTTTDDSCPVPGTIQNGFLVRFVE